MRQDKFRDRHRKPVDTSTRGGKGDSRDVNQGKVSNAAEASVKKTSEPANSKYCLSTAVLYLYFLMLVENLMLSNFYRGGHR